MSTSRLRSSRSGGDRPAPIRVLVWLLLAAVLAGCQELPPPYAAAPTALPTPTSTPPPTATPAPPTPTALPTPTPTVAPTAPPTPTPDPLARYQPAMRPGFVDDLLAAGELPRYDLALWIEPRSGILTGTLRLQLTNRSDTPLNDLALRLYPNFPRDVFGGGGDQRMTVEQAAVDGLPVALQYAAQETAVLLPLDPPLAPAAQASIDIRFSQTLSQADDGTWQLAEAYPLLAVHQPDGWRLDVTSFADKVYAESALYHVRVTLPSDLQLISSGSLIGSDPADGWTTHTIVSGPIREFAMSVGAFASATASAGDVTVRVATARGSPLDAAQVAQVAAAALQTFEARFGPYPYSELEIHLFGGQFDGGSEFPGMIMLSCGGAVDAGTRYVTAHEVGHQWWYGLVGNDIYRQPWLDESFAQYSGIIYAEDQAGPAVAEADWQREVAGRYQQALAEGDLPVGLAITDYPDFNVYYHTIYGKGAVFLRTLRSQIGDAAFFGGLQRYYARHRYGVATTAELRRAFEEASGQDLTALFDAWVE